MDKIFLIAVTTCDRAWGPGDNAPPGLCIQIINDPTKRPVAGIRIAYNSALANIRTTDFKLRLDQGQQISPACCKSKGRINGFDGEDVQDKVRFYQLCKAANLPVVPVYAGFAQGEALLPADRERAGRDSLFVKSLRGNLGEGAAIWRRGEGGYANGAEAFPTLDDLLVELAKSDCVVQPLLSDHAALRAAGSEGLSTVRIVTLRMPDGSVAAACALLLMAKGMLSQYGEYFGIDMRDGSLTTWLDQSAEQRRRRGGLPPGFPLAAIPGWQGLIDMVCHAHGAAFGAFATLGWDVVLTDGGALLLEANQGWGIMLHQVLGEPMGRTAIGAAATAWLNCCCPKLLS